MVYGICILLFFVAKCWILASRNSMGVRFKIEKIKFSANVSRAIQYRFKHVRENRKGFSWGGEGDEIPSRILGRSCCVVLRLRETVTKYAAWIFIVGQGRCRDPTLSTLTNNPTPSTSPVNSDITVFPAPELVYNDINMVGVPSFWKSYYVCKYTHRIVEKNPVTLTPR
jgi:hypothetical protein